MVSTPGDDRVRVCVECGLKAHNLAAMSRAEVETFLAAKVDPGCNRFYLRQGGTIQTRDCPRASGAVGHGKRKRVIRLVALAILVLFLIRMAASQPGGWIRYSRWGGWIPDVQPFKLIVDWLDPTGPR
jgi:hypothetical protein